MNEIGLIRAQLATERRNVGAVAAACATTLARAGPATLPSGSALDEFRQACVDYLVCVLAWFEERDRRLAALVQQLGPAHPARDALDEVLARRGGSREVLEKLEAAFAHVPGPAGAAEGAQAWQEFAQYLGKQWSTRRDALEALLAPLGATDWRAFSGIDADGILEERTRLGRVRQTLPAGVTLAATPPRGA